MLINKIRFYVKINDTTDTLSELNENSYYFF